MRRLLFVGAALVALTAAGGAHANGPVDEDVDSYCSYFTSVAKSESDVLMAPEIFGTYGVVNPATAVEPDAITIAVPEARLSVGVQYSFVSLYRGLMLRRRARFECERYRRTSQLHAVLVSNKETESAPALRAQSRVLESALPEAERILRATQQAVADSRANTEELSATQLHVDELHALIDQNRAALQSLSDVPFPSEPIARILRERDLYEEDEERSDAHLREAEAWSFGFKAGYDRVFGLNNAQPWFGLVTLGFNLGGLAQFSHDADARHGRVRWVRSQVEGLDQRVLQAVKRLRALLVAETRRLAETQTLLADLEQRFATIDQLAQHADKLRRQRDATYFDLVKARAYRAYLAAHVADLTASLQDDPPQ